MYADMHSEGVTLNSAQLLEHSSCVYGGHAEHIKNGTIVSSLGIQ